MSTPGGSASAPALQDPLQYLPRGSLVEVRRGQLLYDEHQPAAGLYLVVQGYVAVSSATTERRVVVELCAPDQFVGLPSILHLNRYGERATALEHCTTMFWQSTLVDELVERQPRLGVALIQTILRRTARFAERVTSIAAEPTSERLCRLLLELCKDLGTGAPNGSMRLPHIPHRVLADCIGTSREVVTTAMNRLRRDGYVSYSRRFIDLAETALRETVRTPR
jgi:CRP/FNR family transcriptional regulator